MITDYQAQASEFMTKFGLTFKATFAGWGCPDWSGREDGKNVAGACSQCGDVHGAKWEITIARGENKRGLTFPFWSSWADSRKETTESMARLLREKAQFDRYAKKWWTRAERGGKVPTAYDVLACISSDAYCEADFADWCASLGYDTDSRRAEATHRRCVEFALKIRQFFTEAEIEALAEIA